MTLTALFPPKLSVRCSPAFSFYSGITVQISFLGENKNVQIKISTEKTNSSTIITTWKCELPARHWGYRKEDTPVFTPLPQHKAPATCCGLKRDKAVCSGGAAAGRERSVKSLLAVSFLLLSCLRASYPLCVLSVRSRDPGRGLSLGFPVNNPRSVLRAETEGRELCKDPVTDPL